MNFESIAVKILNKSDEIYEFYLEKLDELKLAQSHGEYSDKVDIYEVAQRAVCWELFPNAWDFHLCLIKAALLKRYYEARNQG